MKRNESVLVYSVTGLLLVILGIAVLFGDGAPTKARPDTEQVSAAPPPVVTPATDPVLDRILRPVAAEEEAEKQTSPDSGTPPPQEPTVSPAPESNSVPLNAQSSTEAVLRSIGVSAIGESERQGDYRRVRVRSGDDLGKLLLTWAGAEHRDLVFAINEEIARRPDRLEVGEWVVLPWIDDEIVVQRYLERLARGEKPAQPAASIASAEPGPAGEPAEGSWYVVQSGDKLWSIASAKVSMRRASDYVDRIVAANPGLDPARIRAGQKILLPVAEQGQ